MRISRKIQKYSVRVGTGTIGATVALSAMQRPRVRFYSPWRFFHFNTAYLLPHSPPLSSANGCLRRTKELVPTVPKRPELAPPIIVEDAFSSIRIAFAKALR